MCQSGVRRAAKKSGNSAKLIRQKKKRKLEKEGTRNLINPDSGLACDKSLCRKGNIPLIFNSFAVKFY